MSFLTLHFNSNILLQLELFRRLQTFNAFFLFVMQYPSYNYQKNWHSLAFKKGYTQQMGKKTKIKLCWTATNYEFMSCLIILGKCGNWWIFNQKNRKESEMLCTGSARDFKCFRDSLHYSEVQKSIKQNISDHAVSSG